MTKRKDTHSFENGQCTYVTTVTYVNKMGGTKSPISTQIAKGLLEYCLAKKKHLQQNIFDFSIR